MSKPYKPGGAVSHSPAAPVDVHPNERERIVQLIASKQSERALDLAKALHKRCNNAASESILLDAYGARLESLTARKLEREAAELMALVRQRFPSAGARLRAWTASIDARRGDPSALVEPLNDPSLPAEKQAEIAARVRRDVVDLRSLAECAALSPEHPLRITAAVLQRAFEAVTTGPVDEAALSLPEVSRSSPLAPWKMAIRAIAAYYRGDEAMCEKCLAAVEPDAAAARLTPPLRKLINQPQTLTDAGEQLVNRVCGSFDALRSALKGLDTTLRSGNHVAIVGGIGAAVSTCQKAAPDLVERLKQHIAVAAATAGVNRDKVTRAMGGSSVKNAYFWRLLARSSEEEKGEPNAIGMACSAWEEFRKHAIRENWFPGKGPEVAALYLYMAEQLQRLAPEALERVRYGFERKFDFHKAHYQDQAPVLRALQPSRGNLSFLSVDLLLERACEADPCRENFERWLHQATETSPDSADAVAERWSAALPHDIPPLLHLMQSAEKRNALKKAFTLMERAEKIDGVNPEVRRARLRLLVSMALRHLRENKPKLAEPELRQIEALPQAQQGDRPAFLAALRFIWNTMQGAKREAGAAFVEAVRLLGHEMTAYMLFIEVDARCGGKSVLREPKGPKIPVFLAWGRVCAVCDDMGVHLDLIESVAAQMLKELKVPKVTADPRVLAALGEAAMREDYEPLAYLVSRAGLAQGADGHARFLFLRARSMPPWLNERHDRCLAAASDLAKRHHDFDLLKRIGEWRTEMLDWLDAPEQAEAAMDAKEISKLVEREIREPLPEAPPDFEDDFESGDDDDLCQCPKCCAERGQLPPELIEMVKELGPQAVFEAMSDMLGVGGKKKRNRRKYPRLDDFDFPF